MPHRRTGTTGGPGKGPGACPGVLSRRCVGAGQDGTSEEGHPPGGGPPDPLRTGKPACRDTGPGFRRRFAGFLGFLRMDLL
jgi:hypothetical protein